MGKKDRKKNFDPADNVDDLVEEEEKAAEEEEAPKPAAPAGKKGKKDKKKGFDPADNVDEPMEEEEEEAPKPAAPAPSGKKSKKDKKKGFDPADVVDDEPEEEAEEEEPVKPAQPAGKKGKKDKKKGFDPADVVDEPEEEPEEEAPKPSKKDKKDKKSKKAAEEEEEEEEEDTPSKPAKEEAREETKLEKKERREREKREKKEKKDKASGKEKKEKVEVEEEEEDVSERKVVKDRPISNDINVHKFNIFAGGNPLFKEATIQLIPGRRYGLVGVNGSGKSTLLHALANEEDDFENQFPEHISRDNLLVQQEAPADDKTTMETVISADWRRTKLMAERDKIEKMTDEERDEHAERLNEIYEELHDIGADSAEARASAILSGLQFLEEQKTWPTKSFSGGWRMRISIAMALFRRPRFLMLDEPTNHLDLHALIWLEDYLQRGNDKQILIIVSHDRDFLTTCTTDILHIFNKKLNHYVGNYDVYEKVSKTKMEEYNAAYEKQQKRLAALKKEGKITTNVTKDSGRESKSKKDQKKLLAKENKVKNISEDADADDLLERPELNKMSIIFQSAGELPMPVVKVEDVTFGYPGKPALFEKINFGLNLDSRVALVGANGTGKSTLLKLVTEELTPREGMVTLNRKLRTGLYTQHSVDQLEFGITPVEYIQKQVPEMNYQAIRNMLGKFGLPGDKAVQKIETLSGGQKARVVFVEMGLRRCHILLLDEPTNHLDLETIDVLTSALNKFEGGMLVITHNISLIQEVVNEIWVVDEDKSVTVFEDEFDDYRELLEQQVKEFSEKAQIPKAMLE